jgi:hypothetical protein
MVDAHGMDIAGCGKWRGQGIQRMALEKIPSEAEKTRIYIRHKEHKL